MRYLARPASGKAQAGTATGALAMARHADPLAGDRFWEIDGKEPAANR